MADKLKLPVGIEDFQEIRRNGFYYLDKTSLIEQLLDSWGKVNLFTRPRRFGKTLNMSMLRYFFEIGTDTTLFDGLHILKRRDISQIKEWFNQRIANNTKQMAYFWKAIEDGNVEIIEQYLNQTLSNTISVFNTKAPESEKENSYHTFFAGMLTGNTDWVVKSNVEAGEGFADIVIKPQNPDDGIIFELKYSKDASGLDKACEKAIKQISDRRYSEYLKNDGRHNMMFYGIAFYKKRCKVVVEKIKEA